MTKAIPAYIAYLKRHDGASAQTRLVIARTRKLERENDRAEGKVISRDDAKRVLTSAFKVIRDLSKDLPKTLDPKLAKTRTAFEARRIVEKGFDGARKEIVEELRAVCGIDPDEDQKKILAGLRKVG